MVHLITGYAGEEHIQSKDQAAFNAAFIGDGEYVMQTGSEFAASITSNSTVRVLDGDILMQGRHIRVDSNEYEDLTITTGSAGTFRNDLLVMTYEKDNGTGIEHAYLEVIKGDEVESNPVDPIYEQGDILNGALKNQMPLYRVIMQGVVLFKLEKIAEHTLTFKSLAEKYKSEFVDACASYLGSLNILDSMEGVVGNISENQIAGGLALKEFIQEYEKKNQVKEYLIQRTQWTEVTTSEEYYADVEVSGLKETDEVMLSVMSVGNVPTDAELADAELIVNRRCGEGSLRIIAKENPSSDVRIQVRM